MSPFESLRQPWPNGAVRQRQPPVGSQHVKRLRETFFLRVLRVKDASVHISAPRRNQSSGVSIILIGELDAEVMKAVTAELNVRQGDDNELVGGSTGVSSKIWQVYVQMGATEFNALFGLIAARQLSHVQILLDPIVRGRASLRSVEFSTSPFL